MSSPPTGLRRVLDRMGATVAGILSQDLAENPAFDVVDRLKHVHEAPLRNLRHSIWWLRKTFFTRRRTPTPAFLVDLEKPEVMACFGRHYFEPGWELSYNYLGEILNIRRVEYRAETDYDWWQVHIRGYVHDDGGIELTPHYETEPTEHPDAHVDLVGLEVEYGMDAVRQILEAEDVEYEVLEPDETAAELTPDSSGKPGPV